MLQDVTSVVCLADYRLRLRFEDGVEGVADVTELVPFTGVFAQLAEKTYFAQLLGLLL